MKKELLIITLFIAFTLVACKKTAKQDVIPTIPTSTSAIKAPANFTWENSRNINFTINITDTRFQGAIYLVTIYDGDPAAGANLLAKGSATNSAAFITKLYLSSQITQVYIVKTAPDNSKTTIKVTVGTADVVASIGV